MNNSANQTLYSAADPSLDRKKKINWFDNVGKKRNFLYFLRIFFVGLTSVGFSFATGWYLIETTKIGVSFAVNIMLFNLPLIFISPFFGKISSRFSKKQLICTSGLFNLAVITMVYILWGRGDNIFLIYMGTLGSSIAMGLSYLTFETGLPQMFKKDFLGTANSFAQIMGCMGKIAAPVIGGLLYMKIGVKSFLLMIISMLIIIVLIDMILHIDNSLEEKVGITESEKLESEKIGKNLDGIIPTVRYCLRNEKIFNILIGFIAVNIGIFMVVTVPLPYIVKNIFQMESRNYGFLVGMTHIGGIVGSFLILKYKMKMDGEGFKKIFSGIIIAALLLLIPIFVNRGSGMVMRFYLAGVTLVGMMLGMLDIATSLFCQREISAEKRATVFGMLTCISRITACISVILSGKIIDFYSPQLSIILGIVIFMTSIIYFRKKSVNGTSL